MFVDNADNDSNTNNEEDHDDTVTWCGWWHCLSHRKWQWQMIIIDNDGDTGTLKVMVVVVMVRKFKTWTAKAKLEKQQIEGHMNLLVTFRILHLEQLIFCFTVADFWDTFKPNFHSLINYIKFSLQWYAYVGTKMNILQNRTILKKFYSKVLLFNSTLYTNFVHVAIFCTHFWKAWVSWSQNNFVSRNFDF